MQRAGQATVNPREVRSQSRSGLRIDGALENEVILDGVYVMTLGGDQPDSKLFDI